MTTHDIDFKLNVETAALRAWPGVEQQQVMSWQARFAAGHTKRANSASPWPPLPSLPRLAKHLDACEAAYAAHGQPSIIKIPDFLDPDVDSLLEGRGYTVADPTLVMVRDLSGIDETQAVPGMTLGSWLPAWSACNGQDSPPPVHRLILETRLNDAVYACIPGKSSHVSCGLGVVEDDLFGIFDICTRKDVRRNGHAQKLVTGLMAAGKREGAATCYLQVVASNAPARALYESLGFERLYSYWYRVQPR